jgi:glycine C-acetyltransferase
MAPPIVAASLKVLDLLTTSAELRARSRANTVLFRERLAALGFEVLPGDHPIIPVMLGDAVRAVRLADRLLEKGVYVIAFSYPVVPHGKARIRTQVSASHSGEDLLQAAAAFAEARDELA